MPNTSRDLKTLQDIALGIQDLRGRMAAAQQNIQARDRGYLTPAENDLIRQMFLSYRNYRIGLYDIIGQHQQFDQAETAEQRDEGFLLALASALTLYDASHTIVNTYLDVPVIRAKLNEPDAAFGMEPGLFEQMYESLTSITNLRRLRDAVALYELNHEALQQPTDPTRCWLTTQVEDRIQLVKRHDYDLLRDRVKQGWASWKRRAKEPFKEVAYEFTTMVMDAFGNIWVGAKPQIPDDHLASFQRLLQPGDFLMVRPERKSSSVFIPGWWIHCTYYHGGIEKLAPYREALPHVAAVWDQLSQPLDGVGLETIEALGPGVVLNPLCRSLGVDHAMAVRPRLDDTARLASINDAFEHLGKPYDFDFDFTRTDRIVCTELIYRSYHGKGPLVFPLKQRFGRPNLSADDIAELVMAGGNGPESPYEVIAICRHQERTDTYHFHEGEQAWRVFAAIEKGRA